MQSIGRLCQRVVSSPTASPVRCVGKRTLQTPSKSNYQSPGQNMVAPASDPFSLVGPSMSGLTEDIHADLHKKINRSSELDEMSTYYFDGKGKAVRPVIALCIAHAYNIHTNRLDADTLENQRKVAKISEMIHTASLVHDDILDHATTRRGKASVHVRWDMKRSTMAGSYILGVGSQLMATINNPDVIQILSQVLADLVEGEFMQLQNSSKSEDDEAARFEHYLNKSFNKTASLMAYSCKACVVLSGGSKEDIENAFQYGKNIGIAFQLVDDLIDFVSSADVLGKPAGADLELGLATAPVLFAARKYPELEVLIARRFSAPGDVEKAFKYVLESDGLPQTKNLARNHCSKAVDAISGLKDSEYKTALINLCEKVINRLN